MEQQIEPNLEVDQVAFIVAGWSIDPSTLRIGNADKTVKLEPKVMAVLEYLAERPGQAVSRQELEENIWAGTVVGYDAISNAIIKLRKAFGDDAHNPQIIETIPKTGYRLIAEVEPGNGHPAAGPDNVVALATTSDVAQKKSGESGSDSLTPTKLVFTLSVPLLLLIAVVMLWFKPWVARVEPASEARMALPLPDKPSIAVLPFNNMSADAEQEYFVDGMTEDLITDLSKLSGLFVVARNSVFTYKGRAVKIREVAEDLGVRYVLEGSVRRVGENVRINAQLIDALNGGHIWAERYDGKLDDVFALQDDVSRGIVEQLAVNLSIEDETAIASSESDYSEAYDLYLKGWGHYRAGSARDYAAAIGFLQKSLAEDPNFSRAQAAIAAVYLNILSKGWMQESLDVQYYEASELTRKALRRSQQNPTALTHQVASEWIAYYAKGSRTPQRALEEAELALGLDPNSPAGYLAKANALLKDDHPREAKREIRKAMRLDPHYPPEYLVRLGQAEFQLENYQSAAAAFEQAIASNADNSWAQLYLAATYGLMNRSGEAQKALARANELRAQDGWGPVTRLVAAHPYFRWSGNKEALKRGLGAAGAPTGGEWYQLISSGGNSGNTDVKGAITVNAREAKALHERGAVFVDTQATWLTGHIPGAHFLEWWFEGWLFNEAALRQIATPDTEIVIYSLESKAKLTSTAAALAVSRGFNKVYYFSGGLGEWKAAGYPVETAN